jgi:NADH-quinone oxidoreductase subunit N
VTQAALAEAPLADALGMAAPELILAVSAMAILVGGAFGGRGSSKVASLSAVLALTGAAVAAAWGEQGVAFRGGFIADDMAAFAKVAIYGFSALSVVLGERWLGRTGASQFEFPVLVMIAALGMGMLVSAGDLISLYVGVELHSLALYVLAAFRRDDVKSSEAGLKYFVLGALSSGLLLYGASLIYGFAGSVRFDQIALAVGEGAEGGVLFGLVFVICGLAFKVSAAPFHMWTPDVYEGAPLPMVAFFTTAPKMAALVVLARLLYEAFPQAEEQWRQVVLIIAMISMAVGAFGGLQQRNLKRLLAYSSISNMGYALLAISAGTVGGVQGLLIFMVLYMADSLGLFACLIAANRAGRPMETVGDFAGLSRVRPGLAVVITILAFSIAGIPPFAGFWAKYFFAFRPAIDAGLWGPAAFGLLTGVVAAFYYLRLVKTIWFDPAPGETDPQPFDAKWIAVAAAVWAFPVYLFVLGALEPYAGRAARSFGIG